VQAGGQARIQERFRKSAFALDAIQYLCGQLSGGAGLKRKDLVFH